CPRPRCEARQRNCESSHGTRAQSCGLALAIFRKPLRRGVAPCCRERFAHDVDRCRRQVNNCTSLAAPGAFSRCENARTASDEFFCSSADSFTLAEFPFGYPILSKIFTAKRK